MIRSSASLMAEDVTVRCRVRRSETALDPKYNERQEMTCTMRNWEVRSSSKLAGSWTRGRNSNRMSARMTMQTVVEDEHHYGPELLLTPVLEYLTNHRDDSPAGRRGTPVRRRSSHSSSESSNHSGNSSNKQQQPAVQYSIPVADIMVVETYNARYGAPLHRLHITTMTSGVFEFDCHNSNGHDILLAFLQASLSPERILDGSGGGGSDCCDGSYPQINTSMSHSSSCLDLDGFTARHVQGRVENETWNEKITRRVGKVVHSLQEMSSTFCDATTCCQPTTTAESRDGAPPVLFVPDKNKCRYPDLELVNEEHDDHEVVDTTTLHNKSCSLPTGLPSGLSMEADPELELAR